MFHIIVLIYEFTIIIFYLNVSFYIKKFSEYSQRLFKFSDYFIFNLNSKTYQKALKYLISKFYINNFVSSEINIYKKEIKIQTIGVFTYQLNWLKSKLDDEFIIKFDEKNPDYLIYNVFTKEDINKKYRNSIKIAIYTENEMPDLNLADYIIAH